MRACATSSHPKKTSPGFERISSKLEVELEAEMVIRIHRNASAIAAIRSRQPIDRAMLATAPIERSENTATGELRAGGTARPKAVP
jgi:hypothetical protein